MKHLLQAVIGILVCTSTALGDDGTTYVTTAATVTKQTKEPCMSTEEVANLEKLYPDELAAARTNAIMKAVETDSAFDYCRARAINDVAVARARTPFVRVPSKSHK